MKPRARLATAFMAVATLMMPFQASALSVKEFDAQTTEQQAEFVTTYVEQMVSALQKRNPPLAKAVHDYFTVPPAPNQRPRGLIALAGDILAVERLGQKGEVDLSKVQIEKLIQNIVQEELVAAKATQNQQAPKNVKDAPKK